MAHRIPVALFVDRYAPGGTQRQMLELTARLDRRRFRVHPVCFHTDGVLVQPDRRARRAGGSVPDPRLPTAAHRAAAAGIRPLVPGERDPGPAHVRALLEHLRARQVVRSRRCRSGSEAAAGSSRRQACSGYSGPRTPPRSAWWRTRRPRLIGCASRACRNTRSSSSRTASIRRCFRNGSTRRDRDGSG